MCIDQYSISSMCISQIQGELLISSQDASICSSTTSGSSWLVRFEVHTRATHLGENSQSDMTLPSISYTLFSNPHLITFTSLPIIITFHLPFISPILTSSTFLHPILNLNLIHTYFYFTYLTPFHPSHPFISPHSLSYLPNP